MPVSDENLLLVEGESDRSFFEEVCTRLGLRAHVRVAPPKDVGGRFNTKQGLLDHLPLLLKLLPQGQLKRLAVVVDADFVANSGLGYLRTFNAIETLLSANGFAHIKRSTPQEKGLTFRHSNGLADLGAWIMPNNRDDGALENFLHPCVSAAEQTLFQRAQHVVTSLPTPKFGPTQTRKAELATWLAWQRNPGRGLHYALHDHLFDAACPPFAGLSEWLRRTFP